MISVSMDPGIANRGVNFIQFLHYADQGLLGSFAGTLAAADVRKLAWSCHCMRRLLMAPAEGCVCPRLHPKTSAAVAASLAGCVAAQLRSFKPAEDCESCGFLPEFVAKLHSLTRLEDLGPLSIDTSDTFAIMAGPGIEGDSLSPLLPGDDSAATTLRAVPARYLLPALADGFTQCRQLSEIDLTIKCSDMASAKVVSEVLLPAIGTCKNLQVLRLDLDATLECSSLLVWGVARLLKNMASNVSGKFQCLSLGYILWSEASLEALTSMKESLQSLSSKSNTDSYGGLRQLAIFYPQDQELGGLDAACIVMEGAAASLEKVVVCEGWGYDGAGLQTLSETLRLCTCLKEVDLIGIMPPGFNQNSFASSIIRQSKRSGNDKPTLPVLRVSDARCSSATFGGQG